MSRLAGRRVLLALPVLGLTALLAGCVAPAGGYAYGGTYGADYYEPFAGDLGGWGPGYRVGPFRGDEHFDHFGFGHHGFHSVGGFHGVPTLPHGGDRGGGGGGGGGRR